MHTNKGYYLSTIMHRTNSKPLKCTLEKVAIIPVSKKVPEHDWKVTPLIIKINGREHEQITRTADSSLRAWLLVSGCVNWTASVKCELSSSIFENDSEIRASSVSWISGKLFQCHTSCTREGIARRNQHMNCLHARWTCRLTGWWLAYSYVYA
jgi:hypothetical protein